MYSSIRRRVSGSVKKIVLHSYTVGYLPAGQSQVLCKPSMWCRIEAPHRRFLLWEERIAVPKKTSAEQKSVNCYKQVISAAWMTSRICSRKPLANSWKMDWMQNWMTNSVTASTITRTKTPTTAGTGIVARCCAPASGKFSVPRDRKGEFEPQVLKKNQTSISQDIEEKILSMYA